MQTDVEQATAGTGSELLTTLAGAVHERVVGQDEVVEGLLIALLTGGHVLLEGLPGLAKTLMVRTLAEAIHTDFRRIQFTPDLLPTDIVGTPVFDQRSGEFKVHKGPIFSNIILADEINRAPPKVQAALLEAMEERQVTIAGETYTLDSPFMVLATQNPLDLVGTYPLPTPQLDRFLFKITMDHIDRDAELDVLDTYKSRRDKLGKRNTVTREQVLAARAQIDADVAISSAVKIALVDISRNLRQDDRVLQGNSTRSMVLMLPALQVSAALRSRNFVSAEDIELLLPRVLEHRIELAPGVSDIAGILADNMRAPMEQLARGTLS